MGLKETIPDDVEGVSFADYLTRGEGETPSSQIYIYIPPGEPDEGIRGVLNERYTYAVHKLDGDSSKVVLFDRQEDPFQLNNIANDNNKLVNKLNAEMLDWLQKTNDPWLD